MYDNRPIGVFDSGLGGLSVLDALLQQLPEETFLYLADSAWCPYGDRSIEEIRRRSSLMTEFLIGKGVKAIVVACNTATAAAIDMLRETYPLPFIGIEPAVKQAALHTTSGKVGVLATRNTFQGRLFRETSARYATDKDLYIQVGDGLVEIVEEDRMDSEEAAELLKRYIVPMMEAGVDQIVLGCTHYPFLIPYIKAMVPGHVVIHNPAPAVARQTVRILEEKGLTGHSGTGHTQFFTTGNTLLLDRMVCRLGFSQGKSQQVKL